MIDMNALRQDLIEAFVQFQYRLDAHHGGEIGKHPYTSARETHDAPWDKYRNDPIFRAKVTSLVVGVMEIVSRHDDAR